MLVQNIAEVPDQYFYPALEEVNTVDWQLYNNTDRSSRKVFSSSTNISLRIHAVGNRPRPTTINEWCMIVECEDNPQFKDLFPAVRNLCDWMHSQVSGKRMGRIMIVNLAPGGKVSPHIDPLIYFETYSRYHVPLITNPEVVFSNGSNNNFERMPVKRLCRLNNRTMHQVENLSALNRIHVIADIETQGGNKIF